MCKTAMPEKAGQIKDAGLENFSVHFSRLMHTPTLFWNFDTL